MAGLKHKHIRFCQEYVIDENGARAYIRAGYSEKGAAQGAERLLRKVDIANCVNKFRKEITEKCQVKAETVIREIGRIGLGDLTSLYNDKKEVRPVSELTEDQRVLVGMKSSDKLKALEMLAKYLGLFEKDNAQKNPENKTTPQLIERSEELVTLLASENTPEKHTQQN